MNNQTVIKAQKWYERLYLEVIIQGNVYQLSGGIFTQLPEYETEISVSWQNGVRLNQGGNLEASFSFFSKQAQTVANALLGGECHSSRLILYDANHPENPLFTGILKRWETTATELKFVVDAPPIWNTRKRLCRDLSTLAEGKHLANTTWLPVVFGDSDYFQAIPLFAAKRIRSANPIMRESDEIFLTENPDWPSAGRIQINDEILFYNEIRLDPPRLAALSRSQPRIHENRPLIYLIPNAPLQWIVADHQAGVLIVSLNPDEPEMILSDYSVSSPMISGIQTTAIERSTLPLNINYADLPVVFTPEYSAADWEILQPTTALQPLDAFTQLAESLGGALLRRSNRFLRARYKRKLYDEEFRLAKIRRAKLVFQIRTNGAWGQSTEIHITCKRGNLQITAVLNRTQFEIGEPIVADATLLSIPQPPAQLNTTRWERLYFERIESRTGVAFNNFSALYQQNDDAVASLNVLPTQGNLTGLIYKFTEPIGQFDDSIKTAKFCIRLKSSTLQSVRLEASFPFLAKQERRFVISSEWSTVSLTVEINNATIADLYHPDFQFTLIIEEEGFIEVSRCWLDYEALSQNTINIPRASISTKSIANLSNFILPKIELDFTTLIPESTIGLFSATEEDLEISFDLVNADPEFALSLQACHLSFIVLPTSNIQITDKLYIRCRGLASQPTGLCSPARVIRELISNPRFLNNNTAWDESAFAQLIIQQANANLWFTGTFTRDLALATVLKLAFEESLSFFNSTGTGFSVGNFSALENQPAITLELRDLLLPYPIVQHQKPRFCAESLTLKKQSDDSIITTLEGFNGEGKEYWAFTWLRQGVPIIAEYLREVLARTYSVANLTVSHDSEPLHLTDLLKLPERLALLPNREGLLSSVGWKNARQNINLELLQEWFTLFENHHCTVKYRLYPYEFQIVVQQQLVLSYKSDILKLKSHVVENVLPAYKHPDGFSWNEGEQRLRMWNSSTQQGIEISQAGVLYSSVPIEILAQPEYPVPLQAIQIDGQQLLLSVPTKRAVLSIYATTIKIFSTLNEYALS